MKLAQQLDQRERQRIAQERAKALESTLSRLTIRVSHAVPELRILRDGVVLSSSLWGLAVPVDPGEHEVVAIAPGYVDWQSTAEVREGAHSVVVEVPRLEAELSNEAAEPPAAADSHPLAAPLAMSTSPALKVAGPAAYSASSPRDSGTADAQSTRRMTIRETAGWVLGGVGVVGVAVGTMAGMRTQKANDAADAICPSGTGCSEDEMDDFDEEIATARTSRKVAIAGFAAGAAALIAGGVLLWFEYGSGDGGAEVTATAGYRHVGLNLRTLF